jgi:hypothetical protein
MHAYTNRHPSLNLHPFLVSRRLRLRTATIPHVCMSLYLFFMPNALGWLADASGARRNAGIPGTIAQKNTHTSTQGTHPKSAVTTWSATRS